MRASWKGCFRIGELTVPVRLFGATRSTAPRFVQLHATDYSPVQRVTVCMKDGEEITEGDIVRAVEHEGRYIELSEDELEERGGFERDLVVHQITEAHSVDPVYYDKPYYMTPDEGGEMAYSVLRRAFEKTRKVAIATFLFYGRERLAAVAIGDGLLTVQTLRFQEEIIPKSELKVPALSQPSPAQIRIASQLLEQYSLPFHASDYRNQQDDFLNELIERRAKGLSPRKARQITRSATPENEVIKKIEQILTQTPRVLKG